MISCRKVPALFTLLTAAALAAEPPPAHEAIAGHIRNLGADDYKTREAASNALRAIGHAAIPALEKAAESDDPEVRARAREVLADIRLGIHPDLSPEQAALLRHHEQLEERERPASVGRIAETLKDKAMPFLIQRLLHGSANEAGTALDHLKRLDRDEAARRILACLKEARTPQQAAALGWAQARTGATLEAIKTLKTAEGDGGYRHEVIGKAIRGLLRQLEEGKFKGLARDAEELARAVPEDTRVLYLWAEALVALDQDGEAAALRKQARELNPGNEAPHYTAGELLGRLGRRQLATLEWETILEMPPANEVYDINAHLRLGAIYEECGQLRRAAERFDTALRLYANAREGGHGMGIMGGGGEEGLRKKVTDLRQRAARTPPPDDLAIRDALDDNEIRVDLQATVKDDKHEELQRELAKVEGTLTMNVQPRGFRLFDQAPATLRYDRNKGQIEVLLNNAACCPPAAFKSRAAKPRVAVTCLDCTYFFEIDAATGQAKKLARYENDYVLRLRPGLKVAACDKMLVTINGKRHDWEKALKGIPFDFLPEAFEIELDGTAPSGRRVSTHIKLKPEEPEIRPTAAAADVR